MFKYIYLFKCIPVGGLGNNLDSLKSCDAYFQGFHDDLVGSRNVNLEYVTSCPCWGSEGASILQTEFNLIIKWRNLILRTWCLLVGQTRLIALQETHKAIHWLF